MAKSRELDGINIESGVSAFTGKGFCKVEAVLDDGTIVTGQLSPDEVRETAIAWITAAGAAEHDALVWAELRKGMGLDTDTTARFLVSLRQRRSDG